MLYKNTNIFKKAILLLSPAQKFSSSILVFLMFISSLLEVFGLGLIIIIMNFFLNPEDNKNSFLFNILEKYLPNNENSILFILSGFFIIFLLKIIILIYLSWFEAKFLAKFKEKLSNRLFDNFLKRNAHQILKKNSSEYLRNFTSEIDLITIFYYATLKLLLESILLITLFIFLVNFDVLSSITTIIVLTLLSLGYFLIVKKFITSWGKKRLYSQKKKLQFVSESFSAIKYIKILAREKYFFEKFKLQNSQLSNIAFKMSFINTLPRYILEFFLFVSILMILTILFKNNYEYQEIVKIISVYIVVSIRLIPASNKILGSIQNIRFTQPAFTNIFNELQTPVSNIAINSNKFVFRSNILIKFTKFSYNKEEKPLLKNINLKINKKEKIGIIGTSGSGKSTLIDIICGFIKLDKGNILIDRESIKNNLPGWQKIIGYIPQKVVILNDTLRNNILFGLESIKYNDNLIKKIISKVNLKKLYSNLPKGLDEKISEEGFNISGGEIQRIGIARALINNPELIILDESTSALDTFTENKILKEINSLNKTVIFVSHRTNTLKYCNKIYHLDGATLKNYGSFKKLSNKTL